MDIRHRTGSMEKRLRFLPSRHVVVAMCLVAAALLHGTPAYAQFCEVPLGGDPTTSKAIERGTAGDATTASYCPELPWQPEPEPPLPPPSVVTGYIDGISANNIVGWACSTHRDESIDVHLYLGGAFGSGVMQGSYRADNPSEPGVASACSAQGARYRFAIPITNSMVIEHGGKSIHVHGISPVGGTPNLLNHSGQFRIPVNTAPNVSLTSPASGTAVTAPGSFVLRASASDPDDGVASVTFYANGQLLGTDATAPYELTWSGVGPGQYSVHAVARDTRGASTGSNAASITVSAPVSVVKGSIEGVTGNQIVGWACSTYRNEPIDVHLYVGGAAGTGVGVGAYRADRPSDHTVAAACQAQGAHYSFAIPITDDLVNAHGGQSIFVHGISPVGGIPNLADGSGQFRIPVNAAPSVSLTSPASGSVVASPASFILRANASDPDDGVASVTFYANGHLLGTDATAPYELTTWSGVGPGNYSVHAVARDTRGASTASNAANVEVRPSEVYGSIDGISGNEIVGWACSTFVNDPIDVHLYLGGAAGTGVGIGGYRADRPSEPGVANTCHAEGTNYRFAIPITDAMVIAHGGKTIFVHGISPVGGPNHLIGQSGHFRIPGGGPDSVSRRYVYDTHRRLCKVVEPESGATVMDYDAAGNIVWSAAGLNLPDPAQCNRAEAWASGRVVLREYDGRSRLRTMSFPDRNGDQDWQYTPDGLPREIITYNDGGASSVVNTYTYNARRLLTGESVQQNGPNGWTFSLVNGHDANGNLARITLPDGERLDLAPNALGQATQAISQHAIYATAASYYPNGALRQFRYGNGLTHGMQQNERQLPARVTNQGVFDFSFRYDENGNTTNIDDLNQLHGIYSGSRDMRYDALDRLTYAHLHWLQIDEFSYDVLDNIRAHMHFNGVTAVTKGYWYDHRNQLTNIRDAGTGATIAGLAYDAQGNLENKNGQVYSFDFGNRLRSAAGKERYGYDGHGRRVSATGPLPGGEIRSMYGVDGVMRYQQDYRSGKTINYVHLAGSLIALRETQMGTANAVVSYQHTDALGSPVATTNQAGEVTDRTHYEPYGAPVGKVVAGVGYTGHVMDAATGLAYMQQRYYDPGIGRFLSVDPVTAYNQPLVAFNRYRYANNNPYKFTDPDGRFGLAGASIGAGIELGFQLIAEEKSWSEVNWSDVGVAAAVGAVTGGVGGRFATAAYKGTSIGGRTVTSARAISETAKASGAANVIGEGASSVLDGKAPNAADMATAGAVGYVGGAVGARIGNDKVARLESQWRRGGLNSTVSDTTSAANVGRQAESFTSVTQEAAVDVAAGAMQQLLDKKEIPK